jgi:SpoVK/Ycf46/Vps4 family AAA+-type ATPase
MGGSSGVPIIMSSFARWQSNGHIGDCLKAMIATFDEATAAAPSILFIDEIDSAASCDSSEKQNSSYRRQVINGFLEQIDVAMRAEGVMLVGACNDVAALDPAILRPDRFDSICEVPLPGRVGIRAILERQLPNDLDPSELDELVTAAIGSTPATIDGAIRAARNHARFAGAPMQTSDVINRLNNGVAPDRTLIWRIAIHEGLANCEGGARHGKRGRASDCWSCSK